LLNPVGTGPLFVKLFLSLVKMLGIQFIDDRHKRCLAALIHPREACRGNSSASLSALFPDYRFPTHDQQDVAGDRADAKGNALGRERETAGSRHEASRSN